jgi:hypothetical protein
VPGLYFDKNVANTWKKRFGEDWKMRNVRHRGRERTLNPILEVNTTTPYSEQKLSMCKGSQL